MSDFPDGGFQSYRPFSRENPAVKRLATIFANGSNGPPAPVGYTILGLLGKGGMGEVYRAHHGPLDRPVALKFIRRERFAAPAEVVERFLVEARATARFQHPHVIGIYEVGENAGHPFLALEYAEGGSLAGSVAGGPRPPLEAARIVVSIAAAIEAAHRAGIVHRDLKPANILIASDGTIKVGDFGLASIGPTADFAEKGPVGTPCYMSPEQSRGESVGVPSDIWAMGAILYECLSGRPPFRGSSPTATILQIQTLEPVPPRLLVPGIPRDLETICLKCLQKSAAERYASAGDVAEDLGRFLAGEPIRARSVGAAERLVKWAKRRPLPAVLAAALALALVAATVGGFEYQRRLRRALDRAEANAAEAGRERARAEANLREAAVAVDRFLTRVGDEKLRTVPEMEGIRTELLADAVEFYRRLAATSPTDQPALRREAARASRRLGDVLVLLGRTPDAEAAYREAIAGYLRLSDDGDGSASLRVDRAAANQQLADLLVRSHSAESEVAIRDALESWTGLAHDFPDDPEFHSGIAAVHNLMGTRLDQLHQTDRSEQSYAKAVALWRTILARDPGHRSARGKLAIGLHNWANALARSGRTAEALAVETDAVAAFEVLHGEFPDDPDAAHQLASGLNNLGVHRFRAGRLADAAETLNRAIELRARFSTRHPKYLPWKLGLAESALTLAGVFLASGKGAEAADVGKRAIDVYRELVYEYTDRPLYRFWLAGALQNTAQGQGMAGRPAAAMELLDEALATIDLLICGHPDDASYRERESGLCLNRGNFDLAAGRAAAATAWFERGAEAGATALALAPQLTEARTNRAFNLASLAMVQVGRKNYRAAIASWDAAENAAGRELRTQIRMMLLPTLLELR